MNTIVEQSFITLDPTLIQAIDFMLVIMTKVEKGLYYYILKSITHYHTFPLLKNNYWREITWTRAVL